MKPPKDPHLLSGAYALDAVSGEEAEAVEAAMRSSEELRGEVAELTDTAVVLGLSVPPAEPPPALRARLLDLIDSTPQLPPDAASVDADAEPVLAPASRMPEGDHVAPRRRAWRRRPAVLLAAVAAAVLLFGGGLAVDRMLQPPSQNAAFVQLTSASDVHQTRAAVAGGGTATVYWSASLNESAVVLNGVDRPEGKSLQMWVVTGGTPKSVGLYTPSDGDRFELMQGALQPNQAVAVTVEPAGGSKRPTTKPIVVLPTA
ncbi:MAG: anti-sigma factor [Amnibacterium sp.]